MKIDVVVPVYNNPDLVAQCINCLLASKDVGRITVVDDASDDVVLVDYLHMMHRLGTIKAIPLNRPMGFIAAVNSGVASTSTKYVGIINSDVTPEDEHSLTNLASTLGSSEANATTAVAGAKLLFMPGSKYGKPGTIQHAGVGFNPEGVPYHPFMHLSRYTAAANVPKEVAAVTGAVFMVDRDIWDKLGGFDTMYSPGVYEDVDYCLRAKAAGYSIAYKPISTWYHLMHGSQVPGRDMFSNADNNLSKLRSRFGPLECDEAIYYGI